MILATSGIGVPLAGATMRLLRLAGLLRRWAVVAATCGAVAGISACTATTTTTTPTPSTSATTSATSTSASSSASASAGAGLTLDRYNQISNGMTEQQVTALTGSCQTISEGDIAGVKTKSLLCDGDQPLSKATFIFTGGTLVSKSQFGLGGTSGETRKGSMTLDKFNQLQNGQSTAQVEAITGPCEKGSETELAGHKGFTLTCYAADGMGTAFLLFADDTLQSMSQAGLK